MCGGTRLESGGEPDSGTRGAHRVGFLTVVLEKPPATHDAIPRDRAAIRVGHVQGDELSFGWSGAAREVISPARDLTGIAQSTGCLETEADLNERALGRRQQAQL